MKLTTTKGKVIDTNKLSDKGAEIHEALNHFYKTCEKYNVLMFCRVVLDDKRYCGAQTVKVNSEHNEFMLELMNNYLNRVTKGDVVLFKIKK